MKSLKVFYYLSAILALSTISLSQEDWISLHNSNQWNNELYAIKEISIGNAIVVGNEGIILKIMKYGESITKVESNKESTIKALSFVDDSTGWTVGQNSTILKTTDSGITWMDQSITGDFDFCSVSFVDSNKGWIIANQGSLLKTTDGGKNWITLNFSDWVLFSIQFIDSLNGWISSSNYISKTTDGGNSWTKYTTNVTTWSLFFLTHEKGWAVGTYGVIYKTIDGGITWANKPTATGNRLLSVVFKNEMEGYAVGEGAVTIQTNDGGETWQNLSVPGGYSITSGYSNSVWISGSRGLILYSKDGKNWDILSSIYLNQNSIPNVNFLNQNYPNPFNPSTTIQYSIPQQSFVTLKVYDLLGREVETLANEEKLGGIYETEFNGSNLPSGVYFYQLRVSALQSKDGKANGFVEIKKMILLR